MYREMRGSRRERIGNYKWGFFQKDGLVNGELRILQCTQWCKSGLSTILPG